VGIPPAELKQHASSGIVLIMSSTMTDAQIHRSLAVDLFNQTWMLMEKPNRSPEDNDNMIHGAHASCHHWGAVGDATNHSIGEWQISRVYTVLKRPEPALYHARRCLEISEQSSLKPFNIGYAHEAIARALSLTGDPEAAHHLKLAHEQAAAITDSGDQNILLADLKTVPVAEKIEE
jgi:hypothetical protein